MFVSKIINKESVTKVKYVAMCPLLWCRWAKSGKEMDTMVYVCKWDDTAYRSTSLILKGGNLIQEMIVAR